MANKPNENTKSIPVAESAHASELLERMKQKKRDFFIRVGNKSFEVHKSIISLVSGYFEALFESGMKEVEQGFVEMRGVTVEGVKQCIGFMYRGQAEINTSNVQSILQAAHLMQLGQLVNKCFYILHKNLSPLTCLETIGVGRLYSNQNLEKQAQSYLIANFMQVVVTESYPSMGKVDLIKCLKQNIGDHKQKWKAVTTWLAGNNSNIADDIAELMIAIQATEFPFSFLFGKLWGESIVQNHENAKKMVLEGMFSKHEKFESNISIENYFILKDVARNEKLSNLEEVLDIFTKFLQNHFEVLSQNERFVDEFSSQEIKMFFASRDTKTFPRTKLRLALDWAKRESNRKADFKELFEEIDLEKIPRSILAPMVEKETLIMESSKCRDQLFHFLLKAKDTVEGILDALFSEPSIFTLDKETGVIKGYALESSLEYTLPPVRRNECTGVFVVRKKLYVRHLSNISVLESSGRWKKVTNNSYNGGEALVFQEKLYLFRGLSWHCFNPENNSWSSGQSHCQIPSGQHFIISTKNSLYGFEFAEPFYGTVRFFPTEPKAEIEVMQTWNEEFTQNVYLATFGDYIYSFYGLTQPLCNGRQRIIRFNCKSNLFEAIAMPTPAVSRTGFGICAVNDTLYLVGGDTDDSRFALQGTIEAFNSRKAAWEIVRHIDPINGPLFSCGYTPNLDP